MHAERVSELALVVERIAGIDDLDGTRAVEVTTAWLYAESAAVRCGEPLSRRSSARGRCAWVFTSATLSLGEDFTHFTSRLGLNEAETLKIDSPFDYETQSILLSA